MHIEYQHNRRVESTDGLASPGINAFFTINFVASHICHVPLCDKPTSPSLATEPSTDETRSFKCTPFLEVPFSDIGVCHRERSRLYKGKVTHNLYERRVRSRFRSLGSQVMVRLLYRMLQSTLGNLAHVGDGCRQQNCIQNCAKAATISDMVTFGNFKSPSPYPMVPSPTS